MTWLTENWIWIVLGLGVVFMLLRGGHHGHGGMVDHSYGGHGGIGHGGSTAPDDSGYGGDRSQHPAQPALAVDPVTREDVSTATALTSVYEGRIYYFVNAANRQRFESSPAQFSREGLGHSLGPAPGVPQPRPRRRGGC